MASSRFQRAETKGRYLFGRLKQRLRDPSTEDAIYDPIEIHYNVRVSSPESALDLLSSDVRDALVDENVGLDDWRLVNIYSISQSDAAYSNYFNPAEGSILCWYNDKRDDTNAPENRLQWSQAIFEVYQMPAMRSQQPVKNTRTIWRHWIINNDT
jgi:hypothetical protein